MASAPVFILRGALRHYGCLLARIRLTRTAAERGPVLSGACGQVMRFDRRWAEAVNGTYLSSVAVQNSILNCFGHVDCRDLLGSFQISDGAGHAPDFVVGARTEAKLFDRFAYQRATCDVEHRARIKHLAAEVRIQYPALSRTLDGTRGDDACAEFCRAIAGWRRCKTFKRDGADFNVQVNAVDDRTA